MSDPNQVLMLMLGPGGLKANLFPPQSRYNGIETAELTSPDGRIVKYIRRRFLPQASGLSLLEYHTVVQGDRLDNIAALRLGDPEQFWRVCDANNAMNPDDMTEPIGRLLRITLPEGIPGDTAMNLGYYLTLLVGPVIPVPVPSIVLDALTGVTVTSSTEGAGGFQLSFTISNKSPLQTLFLVTAGQAPMLRVVIVVTLNGLPQVMMDGVITRTEVLPGGQPGQSVLTIIGEDLTKAMDLVDFSGIPYPAMPMEARVALITAKYAMFGMIPMVIPSLFTDVPIPTERYPIHKGTDLQYIRQMASDAGYVFYVEPGPAPLTNLAYWVPELKIGVPQPALNLDMDSSSNVESLSFNFNTAGTTLPIVFIQNQQTKIPIPVPIPNLNPLQPPLGVIPAPVTNVTVLRDTAKMTPMAALMRGIAEASASADAVSGSGSIDVVRYGRVLRARQLVGVRGVGMAYDGLYFVKSVTSTIKRGEFKQSFNLTRNGLVSITPVVPA